MRTNFYTPFLIGSLTMLGILFCNETRSQLPYTTVPITLPLSHEDLSLFDFAEVRMETGKSETPPPDITGRKFQPARVIFAKDELHFSDSIKSFWIKFQLVSDQS